MRHLSMLARLVAMSGVVLVCSGTAACAEHYRLAMSVDDGVCRQMLRLFNSGNEEYRKTFLSGQWKLASWTGSNTALNPAYIAEIDLRTDGRSLVVVKETFRAQKDDFFTSLRIAKPKKDREQEITEAFVESNLISIMTPGIYELRKLNTVFGNGTFGNKKYDRRVVSDRNSSIEVTNVNDFEVLSLNNKYFVTMRTLWLENQIENHEARKWRIVARYDPATAALPRKINDELVDVCYFALVR